MALETMRPASGSSQPSRRHIPPRVSDNEQVLRGPLSCGVFVGLFGGGGGEQFGGEGLELFDGQAGGVFGEEAFHVQRQVVVQARGWCRR